MKNGLEGLSCQQLADLECEANKFLIEVVARQMEELTPEGGVYVHVDGVIVGSLASFLEKVGWEQWCREMLRRAPRVD